MKAIQERALHLLDELNEKGFKKADVAKILGVSNQAVHDWYKRKYPPSEINSKKIRILHREFADLIEKENDLEIDIQAYINRKYKFRNIYRRWKKWNKKC